MSFDRIPFDESDPQDPLDRLGTWEAARSGVSVEPDSAPAFDEDEDEDDDGL